MDKNELKEFLALCEKLILIGEDFGNC